MLNDSIKKKICMLYKKGRSLREISEMTKGKVSHETVRSIVRDAKLIRVKKIKNINKGCVRKFVAKTNSCKEAAKKFDISLSYVYCIINEKE